MEGVLQDVVKRGIQQQAPILAIFVLISAAQEFTVGGLEKNAIQEKNPKFLQMCVVTV